MTNYNLISSPMPRDILTRNGRNSQVNSSLEGHDMSNGKEATNITDEISYI